LRGRLQPVLQRGIARTWRPGCRGPVAAHSRIPNWRVEQLVGRNRRLFTFVSEHWARPATLAAGFPVPGAPQGRTLLAGGTAAGRAGEGALREAFGAPWSPTSHTFQSPDVPLSRNRWTASIWQRACSWDIARTQPLVEGAFLPGLERWEAPSSTGTGGSC
jgi:hypothetical protein